MLEIYKTTEQKINDMLDFEYYTIEDKDNSAIVYLMDVGNELLEIINNKSDKTLWKEDIDLNELEEYNFFNITMLEKLRIFRDYLINNTTVLFEEIYMHEDDIKRNIMSLVYIQQMIKILEG